MRSLNALIWRNLTAHPLRSILTALAITLGVAMVLAASIVGQAASQSAAGLSEEGPRVDLEVFSRDGTPFDDAVLDTLRASPDVERVSPSLRVEVEGIDPEIPSLTLLGVDRETYADLHQLELANGAFLDGPDTIVLPMKVAIDNRLNVGDEMALESDGYEVTLTVAGRLRLEQDIVTSGDANAAYVPLAAAQTLNGAPGQIDQVALALRPGADPNQTKTNLAAQLSDDLAVAQVADGGSGTFSAMIVQVGLAMVGVIILFAAAFVIMNGFAMSVTGRTREIGALRALGMTRRQVMSTVLAEAGLLGLTGAALGLLTGTGLAWSVMRVRGTLDNTLFAVPWWGIAASVTMGLTVTLIGALQPARRASRVSPLTALRATGAKSAPGWYERHGGRVGGLLLLVLLLGLPATALIVQPDFFISFAFLGVGIVGLLLGTVLLMPALVQPAARLVRPTLVRWFGTTGRLAADNLTRNKLRTALTAGALTIGLTTIIVTSTLLTASLKGGLNAYFGLFHEDCAVIPDIPALLTSGELTIENSMDMPVNHKLDPALVEAVAELDVGTLIRYGFAPIPTELSSYLGAPGVFIDPEIFLPLGNFDFFEGDVDSALEMMQRGRAVLLIPITAERLGVSVGDTVLVQTPHQGEVEFTVAGIGGTSTNFTVFSHSDGETYFDLLGLSWLGIVVYEGKDVDATLTLVEETIEPFEDVVVFDMRESGVGGLLEIIDQLQMLLNALLLLAVVVAGLGVVNTMVINVAERRREIALLRAVGATQRQVRRSVVTEAATLGLMAALIATALGLITLALYAVIVLPNGATSVGMRVNWEMVSASLLPALRDLGASAALSLIFGPLVAALAAYYPARQAAAMDVVEATRSERVTLKRTGARRPESRRRMTRSLTWTLAWRNLEQGRTRTILSALAVALGAAMIVAADVTSGAILNAVSELEDAQAFLVGLLDQLDVILTLIGVGITLAAGFLVFNAFAMSITQRRRQIGALRALGMTRRQVMRLVLVEAVITGGAGTLVGLIVGPLMGRGVITLIRAFLGEGMFVFAASNASISSLLLATALGMGVTLFSVLIPAQRATRISPLVALRQEMASGVKRNPVGRALLGMLVALVLTVYLTVAPPGGWVQPPWDTTLTGLFVLLWLGCLALITPSLIGGIGRWIVVPFTRLWGATGRLIADNVRRGHGRVTLTILTLAVALTMIIGMTGVIQFMVDELMRPSIGRVRQMRAWSITPFDSTAGMSGYTDMDTLELSPDLIAQVRRAVEGYAWVIEEWRFVIVPELSFFGSNYFSYVVDPHDVQRAGDVFFTFIEGNWETAVPIMEESCGVLITPLVASKNGVALGETFEVTGVDGPVECTVAGIGSSHSSASIISLAARDAFVTTKPFIIHVIPLSGVDRAVIEANLMALVDRYPDAYLSKTESLVDDAVGQVLDTLPNMFNALLLLAVLTAALGVVNTTVMSVAERRRELGLLRAVGATRRQVTAVVAGEAALMGLIGGGLGLVAGAGVTVILATVYGGNAWGIPNLDLWGAAWRSVQPALLNGLVGLVVAPFICAGAAWLPVRAILRGSTIETMEAERQQAVSPRQAVVGVLSRGSIRTRFVLGTATLMTVVLAGLIGVVTTHARVRLQEQMHDALRTMVAWNAGMIELALPDDTENLDFDVLQPSGDNLPISNQQISNLFDSDAMLRFESLIDDMTANGLVDFVIADRDNVVLIGMDMREIGALAAELETTSEANVYSERDTILPPGGGTERGKWLMHATAPIRNDDGLLVGSVRLTIDAREIQGFLGRLRSTLGSIGAVIIFIGSVISWWLATPLARATQQLTAHAAEVGRGEYTLFPHTPRRGGGPYGTMPKLSHARLSLRTRLTIAMVLILISMVSVLELIAIPIERRHVEDTLEDGLVAGVEWIGQVASEGFDAELSKLAPVGPETGFFGKNPVSLDLLGRLQELTDQMRSDDMAYTALVDEEGTIILSDQLALIGEKVTVPYDTQIEETTWRDEEVWVASTPLRQGREGEQIGALQMAMRLNRVEAFLDESRNLFRLTGLIAVLAGVLLAQGIGGAVTAPVRRLAAGTRRVAAGDLAVQFRVDTKDELALLANAYNQMVVGLQEREWLRDMFGRFVSREVAEALRTGRVRLEGENRVVSILFCDIRGFTARSEQSTPEEMVALLNEYLPVVVDAAQAHEGTVNKFGGDSTLVIYGAPRRLQESAYQAVLTALEMRANLERLNEALSERGEAPIRIGVGINTGTVLAGAVGPPERQEYTVIGDTVNLASRIEALNKAYPDYDVLISGWTYEALGSRRAEFEFADLGEVQIRGKVEPVRVWAVVGWKDSRRVRVAL